MSDGTLRALGLLAAVYQKRLPSIMAIEEPEATIHPGALGIILDVLRHASKRTQVIVSTHSPEVLDADWLEDRHIRVVTWQGGATRVAPLDVRSREALRQHLMTAGELLRANALEGIPAGPDTTNQPALFQDSVV
jgi:predicted ATPase